MAKPKPKKAKEVFIETLGICQSLLECESKKEWIKMFEVLQFAKKQRMQPIVEKGFLKKLNKIKI